MSHKPFPVLIIHHLAYNLSKLSMGLPGYVQRVRTQGACAQHR